MARVKRGPHRRQKRKRILKEAKGYYGKKKNAYRVARQAVERARKFAYRDRRQKKRQFRSLWIVRINAASRQNGLTYNRLIGGLRKVGFDLNRKILADIAVHDAEGFAAIVELAKEGLEAPPPKPAPAPAEEEAPEEAAPPKAAPTPKEEAAAPEKETAEEPELAKAEEPEPATAEEPEPTKAEEPGPEAAEEPAARTFTKTELQAMTVDELKKLAAERGVSEADIEGSGASGNVIKADWVRTLAG